MKITFKLFNKFGNHTIDIKELGTVMGSLGQNPTNEELEMLIAEDEPGNHGVINLEISLK